ncbi:hypothetical protein BJY59DRAFT_718604 [Rhodotorula toruloides]
MASFARPPPPATAPAPPPRTANLPPWLIRTAESPALAWSTSAILYMIKVGDPLNGSGTTTAWSLIYLLLNTRKAIVARSPTALAVTGVVAAQAGLYGSYYFGQD